MSAASSGSGGRRVLRIGKYEVQSYIATGGMGAVYRALDVDLGRTVALKILQPELAGKPKVVERFRREARSAARLNHEHIVTVYEFAEVKGTYLLALEFIEGTDLHEYVSRRGRRPPDETCRIAIQAARALAHAHGQGIVHRDIKPSNFLLTRKDGQQHLKLTDFGLARAVGEDELAVLPTRAQSGPADYQARLTTLGSTVGTVDFMSPEQARDSGSADIRSDIYSLGCTLYFMLTGACPYPGGTPAERLLKHVEQPVPDIRALNPEVPEGLAAVLERMLAKNPAERQQTPSELLHDLENVERLNAMPGPRQAPIPVAAPIAVPAPPPTVFADKTPPTGELVTPRRLRAMTQPVAPELPRRRKRGRKRKAEQATGWLWLTAALGAVAVTAGVVLLLVQWQSTPDEEGPAGPVVQSSGQRPKSSSAVQPANLFPVASSLPRLFTPSAPLNLEKLKEEYEGPLAKLITPVVGDVVYRVTRTPAGEPNTFRSLEEALARAPEDRPAIIEIHDNGPLYLPSLAPRLNRTLVLRAGQDYRPLLAWDPAADSNPGKTEVHRMIALEHGSLALEGLDFVFKPVSAAAETPVLFQINGGTLTAYKCSFSTAGPEGVILARLNTSGTTSGLRLRHCYARGANLTAVSVDGAGSESAEVLLEDSLLVGNEQPLLRIAARDEIWATLRVVRSTLVGGKALLTVDSAVAGGSTPRIFWRGWDAVLARGRLQMPGDLVALDEGVHPEKMSWRVVNCLYAGWRNLLSRRGADLGGTALKEWHKQWVYPTGDKVLPEAWPTVKPVPLAQMPNVAYQTAGTPASWAATSHAGPIGCDVLAVASGQPSWLKQTYEPMAIPPLEAARPDKGEPLDLAKVDVGKHLQTVLAGRKRGQRVVLDLYGKAQKSSSPIRVRNIDLVLRFISSGPKNEVPTLSFNALRAKDAEALIDVEDGNLEIQEGRVDLRPLKGTALPAYGIRVRGGDLRLFGTRLYGPLGLETGKFQSLIDFQGAGEDAGDERRTCAISGSLLEASKDLFHIRGTGGRVQLQNSVLISGADVFRFELGGAMTPRLDLQCLLDHNTIAVRGAVLSLANVPAAARITSPLLVRAEHNVFMDPFAEMPRQASLLRFQGTPIPNGALLWQAGGNAYDQRLHAFAVRADGLEELQTLKDWTRVWGTPGEQQPRVLTWPAEPPATFSVASPRLDRLSLPAGASARYGNSPPVRTSLVLASENEGRRAALAFWESEPMRFALLGDHPDGLDFACALVQSGRHELAVYSGPPAGAEQLRRWGVEFRREGDLEEVLGDPAVAGVIVAGSPANRAAQLRRALQSERHVICVHPADQSPDVAYEAAMIQGDTRQLLLPLLPEGLHPAIVRLAEVIRDDPSLKSRSNGQHEQTAISEHRIPRQKSALLLIEMERWSPEAVLLDSGIPGRQPSFPGWDVLRALGGEIVEVMALGESEEVEPEETLLLAGRFEQGGLFQTCLVPNRPEGRWRITATTRYDRAELIFPQGWPGPAHLSWRDLRGTPHEESWETWNPWPVLVEIFEKALAGQPSVRRPAPALAAVASEQITTAPRPPLPETVVPQGSLTWQDAIRCLELDDAARRSIERRRASTLDYQEATEEAGFKGTMTLVGCGLIWASLLLLILSRWLPWLGWGIAPLFGIFLMMQLLRWAVPKTQTDTTQPTSQASAAVEKN